MSDKLLGSIADNKPRAYKDWDYTRNFPETPETVDLGSSKNYHWNCHKCGTHWFVPPRILLKSALCPYCSFRKPDIGINDFKSVYPELAKEWDYDRNYPLRPEEILPTSGREVWWKCKQGHNYIMTPLDRTNRGRGCSVCANKKIVAGVNDLITKRSELMKEWNWEKNNALGIDPSKLSANSRTRVWWICERGHEWITDVNHRVCDKTRCPHCKAGSTSYPEQYLYWAFKQLYPNTTNRYKTRGGIEYDIAIPDLRLLIEYSGINWHRDKSEHDKYKENLAVYAGFNFINIIADERYKLGITLNNNTIYFNPSMNLDSKLQNILQIICNKYNADYSKMDFDTIKRNALDYSRGRVEYEKSLEYLYPKVAKEFDSVKNKVTPDKVAAHSNRYVWWRCSVCGHEWQTKLQNRTSNKSGCPECFKSKNNRS